MPIMMYPAGLYIYCFYLHFMHVSSEGSGKPVHLSPSESSLLINAISTKILLYISIGVAPITQLHTCIIKIVTFKGGHLML